MKQDPSLGELETIPQSVRPQSGNSPHTLGTSSSLSPSLLPVPQDLGPTHYFNRELSWLEFNARVLAQAQNDDVPLLERVKFLGIFFGNLDEFFMVRVAGLQAQTQRTIIEVPPDGLTPSEQLDAISIRSHQLVEAAYTLWNGTLLPALRRAGIVVLKPEELSPTALRELDAMFRASIFPILTPIAVDPGHPFPHLRNKSLNLGIMFSRDEEGQEPGFGVIQVPQMLPRLIDVRHEGSKHAFVLLEDLIARHVTDFFPAERLRGIYSFRVTRNWDLEIDEEEADDLLQTIQAELRRRDRGNAVRVEVVRTSGAEHSVGHLCTALRIEHPRDVFVVDGPLHLGDLAEIARRDDRRELRDDPFTPRVPAVIRHADDIFSALRKGDILLHHPFDSFDPVVDLVSQAADDAKVLAIKQTLYRAGGDSPIVKALARAAENGKHVTVVVELKARFDEASNIEWARTLEQSGCQVIYGLLGLKTHAKALIVLRQERDGLRRYVHLSTGNYNRTTARLYTDMGLLTCNAEIGEDVTSLFNLLTGYSAPPRWNRLTAAPISLHDRILSLVQREAEHARAGRPARIVAQMNSLVDVDVIDALYAASQAGVQIDLVVRGICCLQPGIRGLSDTIRVHAIVDRFLEHQRVFRFQNGHDEEEVFIASADWMPRNFHRRVEVMIPILDPNLKARIVGVLDTVLADNVASWVLTSDGRYERRAPGPGELPLRSQQRFIELARERVRHPESLARRAKFPVLRDKPEPMTRVRKVLRSKK